MAVLESQLNKMQDKQKRNTSIVWTAIFLIFAVVGIVCWILQLTQGLHLTSLGTYNMWGLYITGFMIFTGVAAGSLFFSSIPYLFRLDQYKPYTRISAYVGAISSIVAASLFIIVDIGNPARAWLFITSGNFASPMFWDFLILGSYMVLSIIFTRQLILVDQGKKEEKSIKPIAILAFIAGILVIVTSFVFSFQAARPMWHSPLQPFSFLVSAFVAALAILMILAFILNKTGYINMPIDLLRKMGIVTAALLVVELIFSVSEVLGGVYPGAGGEYDAITWLVAGDGAIGFWLQLIAIVAGIFILTTKMMGKKGGNLLLGAILALVAVFLIKSNFLQTELFHPSLALPGPDMYGATTGPYIPSLLEIGLSLGILSLGALLLQLGFKKLNLGAK